MTIAGYIVSHPVYKSYDQRYKAGNYFLGTGRLEDAIEAYEKAREFTVMDRDALAGLSVAYSTIGEREKAEDLLYRLMDSLKESKEFFAKHETTSGEYNKVLEYISWIEHMYLKDVADLIIEDPDRARKNIDKAYEWVNLDEFPSDPCWHNFILYYSFLEESGKYEKIAEDYADALMADMEYALGVYEDVYSAYLQSYRRYEANKTNTLAEETLAHKKKVEKMEETINELRGSMESLYDLAIELDMPDVAEDMQTFLSIFS
jgi:tetratricopeptide (TPR) repeat protein